MEADTSRMTETIARITTDPDAKDIASIHFSKTSLKFKCQRCAVFCCKCGGPRLSVYEAKNLKRHAKGAGLAIDDESMTVKNRNDGSCTFLTETSDKVYKCSVYDMRPTLCRLYPFQIKGLGEHSFFLNLIPCCNGLNTQDGEPVDEHFFMKNLRKPFLDHIKSPPSLIYLPDRNSEK